MVDLVWLLRQRSLDLSLRSGTVEGVDVSWAHAVEIEDPTPWLAGGELVLTTGVRLPRSHAQQRAYVQRLAASGAAALGFGVGVRFKAVPPQLVAACEETGLPLIEVPLPTPFVAVIRAVADQIGRQREAGLHHLVETQRSMTRVALRSGPTGIARLLASEIEADVAVLDERGQVLAAHGFEEVDLCLLGDALREGSGRPTVVPVEGPVEVLALAGRNTRRGWVVVAGLHRVSSTQRLLLNHAVALITLLLDSPREAEERGLAVGGVALSMALAESKRAAELLAGFGLAATDRLVVACVRPDGHRGRDELTARLAASGIAPLVRVGDGEILVVVRESELDSCLALADSARHRIGLSGPGVADDLGDLVSAARTAADHAHRTRRHLVRYADLPVNAVLEDPVVADRVREVMGPVLAPLREEPALVEALAVYLANHGAWAATAQALGIHRHTARARIERVSELLGVDLDEPQTRAALFLALGSRSAGHCPGADVAGCRRGSGQTPRRQLGDPGPPAIG